MRFWSGHLRVWRYLCEQCAVQELSDVRRKMLYDYAEYRLGLGKSVSGVNADLLPWQWIECDKLIYFLVVRIFVFFAVSP